MAAVAGWRPFDDASVLRWFDGERWSDAYWPINTGLQAVEYEPEFARLDVSSGRAPWFDIVGENWREKQITRVLGKAPELNASVERFVVAELVPEPDNPFDAFAISVRVDGFVVGYIPAEDTDTLRPVVNRLIASEIVPTVQSRIWAVSRKGGLKASIRLALPEMSQVFPLNEAPIGDYSIIPRGRKVQVSGEEQYREFLIDYLPPSGSGLFLFTLVAREVLAKTSSKTVVDVYLDGEPVGSLSPVTSKSLLPVITHLDNEGITAAVLGTLSGSRLEMNISIDALKAEEISDIWLDGEPTQLPQLIPSSESYPVPEAFQEEKVIPEAPTHKGISCTAIVLMVIVSVFMLGILQWWGLGVIAIAFWIYLSVSGAKLKKPPAGSLLERP